MQLVINKNITIEIQFKDELKINLVGTFVAGIMSAVMGAKRAMTWVAYPAIAFWILIYFGDSIGYILAARFCTGLTGGGFQSGKFMML